jgi:hypothetical protein
MLRFLLLLILSLLVIHTGQASIVQAAEKNKAVTAKQVRTLDKKMHAILNHVIENNAQVTAQTTSGALCAIGIIPGPATSFNIRFGLFNVVDNSLDHASIDSFHAEKGASLLHQSVFDTTAPSSGTLTVEYPIDESGKGPIVLSFTSFDLLESASFSADPDTYDDPDFAATVEDMDGTVIELVYDAAVPNSPRCEGTFFFDDSRKASIAFITQVVP